MGAQVAKIAQVVGENQNFEGLKNAIQILIFVCRYMFLFLFAAILQKCASGSSGKHNFANCIFDAKSVGSDFGRVHLQKSYVLPVDFACRSDPRITGNHRSPPQITAAQLQTLPIC